jgi:hypothetical protein
MMKLRFRRLGFVVLLLSGMRVPLLAQAAAEYALKTAGGLSSGGSSSIGGCVVDAALVTCLSHAYPRAAIVGAVGAGLLMLRLLAGGRRT